MNSHCTTRELCLYNGSIDGTLIFLLQQVDALSVAASSEILSNKLFTLLQEKLQQPLKLLHTLTMFNGLNISQTYKFFRLSCSTYIRKILEGHGWTCSTHQSPISTSMNRDKRYMSKLEKANGPTEDLPKSVLQKEMGFSF